eukprot:EG_transcript_10358
MRIPHTPIAVDEFKFMEGVFVYLLTHIHSDHTGGLCPSWNHGTIYCTEATRAMLLHKFGVHPRHVVTVAVGVHCRVPIDVVGKTTMDLLPLEANHCIGSCMFLLKGYFGTILYTGDFRFHPVLLQQPALQPRTIDWLFLDDTFLEPECCFPSREAAGQEVLRLLSAWPDAEVLVRTDTFGKEELLVAMANHLQSLVHVSGERYAALQALRAVYPIPDVFTRDEAEAQVKAVTENYLVKPSRLAFLNRQRPERPIIAIVPSGRAGASCRADGRYCFRVGYSLHSSYPELLEFVAFLQPKRAISTSRKDDANLLRQLGHLLPAPSDARLSVEVPHTVAMSMASKSRQFCMPAAPAAGPPPARRRPQRPRSRRGARILVAGFSPTPIRDMAASIPQDGIAQVAQNCVDLVSDEDVDAARLHPDRGPLQRVSSLVSDDDDNDDNDDDDLVDLIVAMQGTSPPSLREGGGPSWQHTLDLLSQVQRAPWLCLSTAAAPVPSPRPA